MTNADRQSDGIDRNPNVARSNLWYHAALPGGREGFISEVYLVPASRGGLGLPAC